MAGRDGVVKTCAALMCALRVRVRVRVRVSVMVKGERAKGRMGKKAGGHKGNRAKGQ